MTFYNLIANKGYGIKVTKEKSVENISNDYYAVKNLVDICNRLSVDYDHFEDVLENYVEDYSTF